MGKVTSFDGIDIIIRTRDEHCEPHVHALHEGQGWELRIYFSYVTDQIEEVEHYHGTLPKEKVVQVCMNKVIDKLDKIRRLFWEAVDSVCLENKYVAVVNGVIQPALANSSGALRVKTAKYVAKAKTIEFTVHGNPASHMGQCP